MREGILNHNSQGRYAFGDGYYFTSGDPIEIFYEGEWLKGGIEYSHKYQDYYFTDGKIAIHNIKGLKARG